MALLIYSKAGLVSFETFVCNAGVLKDCIRNIERNFGFDNGLKWSK